MKQLFCLFFICVFMLKGYAQNASDKQFLLNKGAFDFQLGLSVPLQDFADNNFKLESGYALPGYHIKSGFCYDLMPYLGINIQYQYTQNGFDQSKYASDIQSNNSYITSNSFKSNPWVLQGMMIGVYYPFRSANTSIDIGCNVGPLVGVLPENTWSYFDLQNNEFYNFKQFETTAASIGLQLGIKLRYKIFGNLLLMASGNYNYSEITFKNIRLAETNRNFIFGIDDYTQRFQIINVSAGIGIQFK